MGDALEDTRANMREAVELYLAETVKAGEPIPEASTTVVNFEEFDPERESQYFVEWLQVPEIKSVERTKATQAA
jgi:hypothetical protein